MEQKRLKMDNPCPMVLMRMKQEDGSYYCGSCQRSLVDFRGKSLDEVQQQFVRGTCGIFDRQHLEKNDPSFWRSSLFFLLVMLAFLGFNVKPANAQTSGDTLKKSPPVVKETKAENKIEAAQKENKKTEKGKKRKKGNKGKLHRRKGNRGEWRSMGCPAF